VSIRSRCRSLQVIANSRWHGAMFQTQVATGTHGTVSACMHACRACRAACCRSTFSGSSSGSVKDSCSSAQSRLQQAQQDRTLTAKSLMLLEQRDGRGRRGVAGESLVDTPAAGVTAATMLVVGGAPHRAGRVHAHDLPIDADVDPKRTFCKPAWAHSAHFRRSMVCNEDSVASIGGPGCCRARNTAAGRKAPHERPPAGCKGSRMAGSIETALLFSRGFGDRPYDQLGANPP